MRNKPNQNARIHHLFAKYSASGLAFLCSALKPFSAIEGRSHAKSLRETDRQKFTRWQSPAITIREKKKEKACHLFHDSVNGANPTQKK